MVTLYGVAYSRAARCLWMLEELVDAAGLEYRSVPVFDVRSADYLAINPNGKVPALVDDAVVMWESLAINCYLARRYPSQLSAQTLDEEAHCLKWSFWADAELECFFNHVRSVDDVTEEWLGRTLSVLQRQLAQTTYLIGPRFTVADLNVAMMFAGPVSMTLDLSRWAAVNAWLTACRARPAAQRVRTMMRDAYAARSERP